LRQIAKTFAEGKRRRQRREIGGAEGKPPGMPKARMQANQPDCLTRAVPEELVVEPGIQRVEAGDPGPPLGFRYFQPCPMLNPRSGVMRFAKSQSMPISRAPSGSLGERVMVGRLSSSATNGSSVKIVAGKNRAPAKPCAAAWFASGMRANATSAAPTAIRETFILDDPQLKTG
jgi:hypothetical protein